MKRYFVYLMFYSIGGFVLERLINLVFLGYWWDNSVLVGPYQPLYGSGVVLTILLMEYGIPRIQASPVVRDVVLLIGAILFTGIVEASTGYGYQALTGIHLWDYGQIFPCRLEYVCVIPTSMFGLLSFLVVKYLHPLLKRTLDHVNRWLVYAMMLVFVVDIVVTFVDILA